MSGSRIDASNPVLTGELFAAQAAATPTAVAVVVGDVELTYGQVAERAARFGALLRAAGVGPESVVGVCLPREADLVPLLHGVWLAGGAYLPIDPALPGERIDYMLADSGAAVLVTVSGRSVDFAGTRIDLDTVVLDEVPPVPASGAVTDPEQLAYVLYTSGSTGRPKGVMIGHGALHNLLASIRDDLGAQGRTVWLASTSVSFDISGLELHLPLVTGGRVVLARDHEAKDPAALIALIGAHRVTHVQATPSAWRLLLEAGFDDWTVTALTGGEPLPAHLATRLIETTQRVVNVYGPTETTIWSSFWDVPEEPETIAVGHPLANTGLYVLDERLRQLPPGVTGQLFIDGDGVARGYHGRTDLTAEKFLPNPYGAAGSRLYATGDLARFLADGSLECLGRIDSQVKIRGYRIELGEIETVLSGLEQVRQAVVTVHDEALVAYVVPAGGRVDAGELRARLAETLPEYMVPGAFVAIDAVPLSNSGKVDHRALPAPDLDAFATGGYTAPRTPVEERLAAVWAEVLGLPQVGVEDSFFDLGGDSIRAVRLVGALRAAGYDVTIPDVFQQRTIAALAARIGDGTGHSLITAVQPFALIGDDDRKALPADIVDAYPLSQAQTGMLVELAAAQDSTLYHNLNSFRIAESIGYAAEELRRAVDILTERHEILRTSIALSGYAQPLQLVHASARIPLTTVDLRGLTADQARDRAREYVRQERAAGFDLTAAPLLRIAAHIESDRAWHLTFSHSHTVTDGWTLNSLLMELLGVYQALCEGREPAVHEAPAVRYADYIAAEQASLADPADQAFWQQVVDEHSPLVLPGSWADQAGRAPVDRTVDYTDLEDGLRVLAGRAKTSLKSVLLAAHLKVLSALTPDEAFHTGVVYHGRLEAPGADRVLGMHLNTLPFPTTRGARTWRELVERTYATETAIWSHRRYPLPAVQRAAGGVGLLSTLFDYQDFHQVDSGKAGGGIGIDGGLDGGGNEFALMAIAGNGRLSLAAGAGALGSANLERLAALYRLVLESMAADPDGDALAVPLPETDRRLLADWQRRTELPVADCLHELFAARAARTPDAVALTSGSAHLTYAELDERANRIAHHLTALGARPDTVVGVSLERGPDLVPTLLGVLKSGAAYLPLDPSNPADRLAYMLADAKADLLVTHSALDELEFTGTRVFVDAHAAEIAARPATAPVTDVRPDNLIYVIYTSGSTGLPKGVSLTHASVARLFTTTRDQLAFSADDVWALFHSYAFDVSVWEMWGALLHGARLVVVPPTVSRSPHDLIDLLVRERVSVLCQTPSAFRALSGLAEQDDPRVDRLALRTVIFAGERLDMAELRSWAARKGTERPALVNMYGPTEITVYATHHVITADEVATSHRSNIGHALGDLSIHLLDTAGHPVPVGVPGEMHIGGPGLARGYLDRPGLTAERFVPDPFGAPGSRLYRTGDLVLRLPDSAIDFLGRIDGQIKIRGYRVELGEIEAALAACAGVRQAVVTVRENAAGEKSLVGYVVTGTAGAGVDTAALRAALAVTLPEYMVPAAFVALDALPLSNSGKLDRRALPAPDLDAFSTGGYTAPRTPVEERLAAVWAEVLGLSEVGVEDSFFDLGGDSIRAVRLVGALRAAGYDVSIRDVFDHRTVAALAATVGDGGASLITAVEPFALIAEEDRAALPADVVDAYPLSQIQTGMLVELMTSGDRGLYHNLNSFRIPDAVPFDAVALRGALDLVAARHEILRTSLHLADFSRPLQLVHAAVTFPLAVHDLRGLTAEQAQDRADTYLREERAAGFDLTAAPLLRFAAHIESDRAWRLTFSHSHTVTDGWTLNSLLMELLDVYRALSEGREPAVHEEPAVRYADYIAAEQASLADPADQAFWQRIVDEHSPLALPAGWGGERGGQVSHQVPFADLEDGLRALAAEARTSIKSVLLAAHLKVLGSLTSEQAFHTGVVYHGRLEAPGSDRVLGMHLNTLPFPATRGAKTWRELVERTYATESAIWSHRRYPLPAIQRAADNTRDLITVLFDHHDFHQVDTDTVDVDGGINDGGTEFALNAIPSNGYFNLSGSTEYFTPANLERLGAMYRSVLEAMAADADGDARGAHLPADELSRLLDTWNSAVEQPVEDCVHELFAAQAARTPDAIAMTSGSSHLTYAELDERANRIAHHLIALGAGPERIVGLSLERGPDLVPALLGILKSGAAYLPLDPANPADRLAYMLTDAKADLLVTHSALEELEFTGTRVFVDTHEAEIAGRPATAPVTDVRPDNLIYVIYTSGSTGLPKGVSLTHANVARHFAATRKQFGFRPGDVVTQSHAYSFDVSVWEMWAALLHGGRLVVVPSAIARSPHDFLDLMVEQQVTVLLQTPSAFSALAAAAKDGDPRLDRLALRLVAFGGERLEAAELQPWIARMGLDHPEPVNLYGPTETTMHCAYHRVGAEDLADPRRSVIGRPVGDLTIHLLDAAGRLVPTGVPGEIHVGGPGVARGYLDRPALTAERFVPDPFGAPGTRLYATGDLARRLPDGSLDSLGRIDSQVKIRGHRVELGEIESALTAHPDIRDAVVTVHEPAPGVKRLIAYLVAAEPLDLTGLRARLGESLPEYMVPAGYVLLDRIPLTSSSKVDVRALPAPDAEAFDASEYVGPRTPAEERITAIWADVLGLSQVGVRSSFFDLGGDSMRVVRLVGALRAAGFDITVPAVFEHRTVAALAATVGTGGESLITAVRPFALIGDGDRALLPTDAVDAYPLSQVQTGMLVELLATTAAPGKQRSLYHNVNSFLIRDGQPFSLESLQGAVDTVAARHDILRTSMHLEGFDEPLQIVHATADYPVVLEDLRGLDQAERARLKGEFLTREQSRTFDLTVAPLLRVSALVESEDSWRLNFTYSHAISEGWSYNSLLMEVLDCYRALRAAGAPDAYEQPAVRYADFIAAEQTALADPATQAFWQQIVEEHTPLALPAGWAAEAGEATRRHLQVPFADLEDGLRALAARAKTSLKSVLLAAHLKVLSALTPDEAFHTGVVYHGRLEAPGADRVLGMHLNTLPFPATRGARTWRELVERTYATETAIWSHRRYPLPAIQRAAGNTRDLLTVLFEFLDFHQVDTEAVDVDGGVSDGINEFALNVIPTRGSVNFHVSAGVLSEASLERLGGLYRSVLESMAADPEGDARVVALSGAEVAVLSAPGREVVWSTASAPEAFAARVVESPDAVAVVVGDVELTYGQVAERAARFGALLRAAGVGPESVVGVCLPREADLVPLLHGVWLAGGAYLPIDPALPGERIDYMLADSGAAVLVTVSGRSVDFAGTRIDLDTVVLDEVPPVPASGAVTDPERLAYVLYTSGSTGRPKGVMIGHGALHNLLASVRDDLGVPDGSVWLASTSVSFDISGLELHLPLVTGGRVVLARDHEVKDPAALIALVGARGVSHVQATPSAWRLLLEAGFEERSVTALTGGEPLPGHLASALSAVTRRVVNVYGPTETTIWSSFWDVPEEPETIAVGHPLANTGVYVLDEGLRLLPSGVTGQLFIDGDGVARGYHGRADLTAEKFLPNPYGAAGSRLYATGDLARFLADGSLECLGRIDSQVKVRGYRIELGEIETVLSGLEQVRQAVVTVHDEALVAYVVPAGGRVDAGELRARLAETLPEYMVPGAFVTIDAVPLSNSGKVDHRALPAPDLDAFVTGGYTAPRTPVEERLAAVWAEVLGLPRVGVEDSFFDLGGDSIRAVRLVGALRAAGYDVTIPDVFQQRTITALATRIGDGTGHSLITAVQPFALIGEDDRAALPADVVDAYPLSQVQTGMLVELLGSGDRGLYHNLNSFRIPDTAPFDAVALRGALDLVTARHEILRTSLHLADFSQPLQSVHATAEVPLTVHDLRGLTEAEVAERTTAYVEQERAAGFDLAAAPLLRIAVHIESDRAWRVTTSHSHTVTDGWTLNSLLMELLEVYRALRDGREPAVHEAPAVRYADYIAAEQTALSDPQTQAFWQHLVDTHSPLALPGSWADPATPGTPVGRIVHYGDLEDGLRRLATEAKTSIKSVLLAAHLKVMGSLTAEDAFHTGVVYHGRLEAPGADRVLGMHLNTLPFPTTRGAKTWRELVERTYATETAIWSHRRYPLPAVQRAAGSSGDLVSILFEYLDFHVVDENSVDLDGSMGDGANEFALNVLARRDHLTLAGTSAAVDRSRLALLGERYRLVLEAMAADPNGDATLSHLPETERTQLTTWAAGDPVDWPQGLTVDLIEAQAAATPDAVAVIAGDVRLTFREVDERANRIAHHLLTLGAGPDVLVGVCLERGPDLVPTLLGVWKAGAAYLPLDPSWPADRLAYVLTDTATPIVVTSGALTATLTPVFDATLVVLERDHRRIDRHPTTTPQRTLDGQNLAYAIYTSGSTGRPKGVLVHHHGLVNYLNHTTGLYASAGTGGAPLFSSIAFDLGIPNLFTPLLTGQPLTLLPDGLDTASLGTALVEAGPFSFVKLTPGHLDLLTHQLTPTQARDLAGIVIAAGDNFPLTLAQRWQDLAGPHGTRLATEYGPTEITIGNSGCPVDTTLTLEAVPLGTPFPNTGMHVLDEHLHPVPVGVPGEIHIDGTGISRGYHHRPDLTAERFLPNPHGPAGTRLYRTGDLARYLPDGTLETLGRIDNQVKIRGYRIELGEIEARLREHPHITDTVVTVREPSPGNKRLTAYLITHTTIDTHALRAQLADTLPDYMIPTTYLTIDAIPLTPNGKIDHRALPTPDLDTLTTTHYTAPRTPLEERLATIWAETLDLPRIGIHDSFFDLGGDSIRAVQVLAKCREAGVPLALWMMLQAKSLAEVAGMIDAEPAGPAGEDVPLTPSQHRLLASADGGARTVRLALGRLPDAAVLAAALGALVARHEALRLRISADGRSAEPVPAPAGTALLSVLDLGTVAPADRAGELDGALARDRAELVPSEGAMLRATLVRFDDEKRHELWLTIHQLAADSASWPIVLADLNAAYAQSAAGAPVLTAPVEVPWRAWAQELGEQARSERVAEQAEYWLDRAEAVSLPVDRVGDQAPCRATEETVTVVLPAERTAALLAGPRPEQPLLTALGQTLAQWAGGDRILLDVVTDPRHQQALASELANTVGPLADLYPVVLRIPKGRELSAVHTAVARRLRSVPAPAHGYGLLRYLAPDAELAAELAELPTGEVRFGFTPAAPTAAAPPLTGAERDGEPPLVFVPGRIELRAAPDAPSTHLLDIAAEVYDGRLYLHWTYNTAVHEPATVQRLAAEQLRFVAELLDQAGDRPAAAPRGRSAAAPAGVAGVAEVMARHGIPGASLALIRNGELAAVQQFGVLGVEDPAPVTAETLFPAGSISKHVTTFALLRLVEAGVIELDRDVNEYLTSWQVPALPGVSTPVTPRLLIANLSGIAPHPDVDGNYHRHDPVPTVLDVLNGRPPAITPPARLLDEPGATFRQIPLNYSVLQQAMADATGEEFPALVHRLVLAPLGMTGSGFGVAVPDELGRPYARGHHADGTPVSGGYVLNPELAAGGLWTTAADLARLAVEVRRCHLGHPGGLVGAELVRRMLAPQSGRSYGWSTIVDDTSGDLEFGHGGQAVGFQAMTGLRVHSGTGVVLLSNAVTGRELVKHLLATVWTGQNRLAHLWQQAIDEATEAESRLG